MTVTTRMKSRPNDARVEKPRSSQQKARVPPRGRPLSRSTKIVPPRGPRSKTVQGRNQVSPRRLPVAAIEALEARLLEEAHPDPEDAPGTANIARVYNEIYETKPTSLSFIEHGRLETSPDVVTMALNLMDFMLIEANWDPALSQNKLSASCYYFASRVTGLANEAEDIAASFECEAQANASAWATWMHGMDRCARNQYTMQVRAAQALEVRAEDVELGYAILWRMRGKLSEVVGKYASVLDTLPVPAGTTEVSQQSGGVEVDGPAEQGGGLHVFDSPLAADSEPLETETAVHDDVSLEIDDPELVELDDFETSVEDFDS